ncbi:hypothetical protein ATANTOWER_011623 [Ataeniobius toweri]|uniref:Uncharacterized protein n=1 Tax=Ataeniobius toweri TaxID=208326 RepID=A0ABU7AFR3_9TELE|nr:hypothetical protein [Ataeniobius toweri]
MIIVKTTTRQSLCVCSVAWRTCDRLNRSFSSSLERYSERKHNESELEFGCALSALWADSTENCPTADVKGKCQVYFRLKHDGSVQPFLDCLGDIWGRMALVAPTVSLPLTFPLGPLHMKNPASPSCLDGT